MVRKIVLPIIFAVLAYGFWISPDFKQIAAGVAIFLFGMLFLEDGFKAYTGGVLEKILKRTTDKLWKSMTFGVISTSIMQSSSLVSVITISFLSAGLIGLTAGIGIVFGANLGTTTGAWLIAGFGLKIDIAAYAMPMLVFGIILAFQSSKTAKGMGYILAGLGFLFLGIHHMKEGFETFKETIDLSQFAVPGFAGLLLYTGIGIFATVVMQSSHATLVITITALAAGQITYENALALAIGANIGTCITAILGAISANVDGRRLAAAHLIFNVTTGVVAIVLMNQILVVVDWIAAHIGIAADDWTLKLSIFHSLFNTLGILIMVPLMGNLVKVLHQIFPQPKADLVAPLYLNEAVTEFPDTLVETVRKEVLHLYDNAFEVLAHGLNLHRHDIRSDADLIELTQQPEKLMEFDIDDIYGRKVKVLYNAIVEFTSRTQADLPQEHMERIYVLREAARDIVEAIKDVKHMRKNLVTYIVSDNPSIKAEYNKIRAQLGEILRELTTLRDAGEAADLVALDGLRLQMEENDVTLNGDLDRLIREGRITAPMATSLMNDSTYSYDVAKNLIAAGAGLFGPHDLGMRQAAEDIELDDEELDQLVRNPG
ncbi:MAG: Na/Pi cotransporter family protein [Gammaproteobacteria bacterium]|nr:Na/Pi cotransporter family protein [Gammaproteobacteria bacterium]